MTWLIERRSSLHIAALAIIIALVGWIAVFQVIDYDVWWHIASGRFMRATHALIAVEPFAFTRAGQPYLATHEWLAQIILSIVFDVGGASGLIAMRILFVAVAFGVLLALDWRRSWAYALLVVPLALSVRGTLLDRPQLWSFVLFSVVFFGCVRLMDRRELASRPRALFAGALFCLSILWSNVHGGAALLAIGLTFAAYSQRIFTPMPRKGTPFFDSMRRRECLWGGFTVVIASAGLFLTPHATGVFDYLTQLFADNSIVFIQEWTARPFPEYAALFWLPWIASIAAAAWSRRFPLFSFVVLVSLGALSVSARRHEPFFVFAALGITVVELGGNARWRDLLLWVERRTSVWIGIFVLTILIASMLIVRDTAFFAGRNGWTGVGASEPLRGAADFLESQNLQLRAFNTYEAGGYLVYRGQPVFVDGRNVDYGYSFLSNTFTAGNNAATWRSLVDTYALDAAIIYYSPYLRITPPPYISILDADGQWVPVYLDDDAAVYLRATSNIDRINALGYRALSPSFLAHPFSVTTADPAILPILEQEARRVVNASANAMRAQIVLAYLLTMQGRDGEALGALDAAEKIKPYRYEPLEARGIILAQRGDWPNALAALQRAIELAGGEGELSLDYGALATIAEKAGDLPAVERYRHKIHAQ